MKDVELGHHGKECSFEAILKKYQLDEDPALVLLGKIVNGADTDNTLWNQPEGAGLEAIAEGFRHLGYQDDHEQNAAEWIVYDALYAYCQAMVAQGKPDGAFKSSSLELGAPDNRSLLRGDMLRITSMRGLRQIAYGMMAITLAIALTRGGLSPTTIGLLVSVSLAGDLVGTMLIGRWADHWGRRRTLTSLALLMAATGLIFGLAGFFDLAGWYPLLLVAAFFGTLGTSASETAPFLPIEQAMLGQVGKVRRERGALRAITSSPCSRARWERWWLGCPISRSLWDSLADEPCVLVRSVCHPSARGGAACVPTLASGRSACCEQERAIANCRRSRLTRRSAAYDAPAPVSIPASLAACGPATRRPLQPRRFCWRTGGADPDGALLSPALRRLAWAARRPVLWRQSALSAVLPGSPALARRFGLLNTMVFTHLPSNLLLILVPLMPTFPLAAALLLLRQTLSQLDVPTRQAYTMALVTPESAQRRPASPPLRGARARRRVQRWLECCCKARSSCSARHS